MTAILKHELKSYFHSLTAYVFGAFLLVMVGFGSVYYNLMAAVSNFEYVLSFGSIIFVIIVPLLTKMCIRDRCQVGLGHQPALSPAGGQRI